jgi:hypothetical protein
MMSGMIVLVRSLPGWFRSSASSTYEVGVL